MENRSSEDAVKEHQEAKGLLAELAKLDLGTFDMDAKVATLRKAIEHHIKDEEEEIFPKVAKALGTKRVDELGSRIERAKKSAPTRPDPAAAAHSPGHFVDRNRLGRCRSTHQLL